MLDTNYITKINIGGNAKIIYDDKAHKNVKKLAANLLLNDCYPSSDGGANGSCYIGNGKVVSYIAKNSAGSTSNTGKLRCYNLNNYTIEWTYQIKGYHGNSICYNPDNNHIYLCGCIDETASTHINKIVEINLASPSSVYREFSLPDLNESYSMAYDQDSKKFYVTAHLGTVAGTADQVYVYNSDLTEHIGTITLEDFPAVKYGLSTQGVQVVVNGVIYLPSYDHFGVAIYGYDTKTGKIVSLSSVPTIINKCRDIGEIESLVYDYDKERFIVGSCLYYPGVLGYFCHMLFEVSMFKGVIELEPIPANSNFSVAVEGRPLSFTCVIAGDNLKPSWLINRSLVTLPNDCFIYSKLTGTPVNLNVAHSSNGVSEQAYTLYYICTENYSGQITGVSSSDRLNIHSCRLENHSDAQFKWCTFDGTTVADSLYCNMLVDATSRICVLDSTFESISSGSSSSRYHIIAKKLSQVYCSGCTFSGTVQGNSYVTTGGNVTIA